MKFRCERDTLAGGSLLPTRGRLTYGGDAGAVEPAGVSRIRFARTGGHRPRAHDTGARAGGVTAGSGRPGPFVLGDRPPTRRRKPSRWSSPTMMPTSRRGVSRPRCGRCRPPSSHGCRDDRDRCPCRRRRICRGAARQVVSAASRDDARPILTGVLLTAGRWSSLGRNRLVSVGAAGIRGCEHARRRPEGARRAKGSSKYNDCSPVPTVRSTSCSVSGKSCSAWDHGSHGALDRRRVPQLPAVIPSGYPEPAHVARDALQAAVNRVRVVGQSRDTAPIRVGMTSEGLELSAIAQDVGEAHESVEAKYEGSELTVAFNSQFLLDGLDAAASDEVVLESIDPLKPAVLRTPDSPDFLYLLMPVRIS